MTGFPILRNTGPLLVPEPSFLNSALRVSGGFHLLFSSLLYKHNTGPEIISSNCTWRKLSCAPVFFTIAISQDVGAKTQAQNSTVACGWRWGLSHTLPNGLNSRQPATPVTYVLRSW
jgi:hypothetical protein